MPVDALLPEGRERFELGPQVGRDQPEKAVNSVQPAPYKTATRLAYRPFHRLRQPEGLTNDQQHAAPSRFYHNRHLYTPG